ncbi:hypothetical protein [Paenibacillus cremeus]|uniref:Uncharacterized protein n=1 Tax=Paenibacillus cremeus TaxID=2163881 RepID=A0A559JHR8_9BACL|nr:hypothetical protein [Paenibacillus cremeus]TVX99421.1 hypothetical protein FPZ49_33820 [Paenibacillus cremeus]
MNDMNHLNNSRDDQHVKHTFQEAPTRVYHRPWYNQGWVWMIVVLIALVSIVMAIGGLSDQIGNVSSSIQQQTAELRHQNELLAAFGNGLNRIETAITNGFDRLVNAIDNLINKVT